MKKLITNLALENNIFPATANNLPLSVWGFVYKCTNNHYHLIINSKLAREIQLYVLKHEVAHIINDGSGQTYLVGFDCQHMNFEKEADKLAEKL